MRGKLLVVSDWLINGSLKFYSRIATPFAKGGGQLLKRSDTHRQKLSKLAVLIKSFVSWC